jgi:L-fucose mutarotase
MLHGIDPLLTPELLYTLALMGHGDSIAIVDSNFPAASVSDRVHRLHGIDAAPALDAILSLFPLDRFIPNPAITMQVVVDPDATPPAVVALNDVLARHGGIDAMTLERFAFYDAARRCFALVQTGERRPYGNIILTKGVIGF